MVIIKRTEIAEAIQEVIPEVLELRHGLHRHPEIRFQEHWTSAHIAEYLTGLGIAVKRGYCGGTGLVGEIAGTSGRVVALRADMDGLEIQEDTGLPYASEIPGRMHACGHDGHMAMLCGAARILSLQAGRLDCTVRFIFQPGEEMGVGGKSMVEEGVLNGVEAVFGIHGWPTIPAGKVGLKSGYVMAGADWFKITIRGKGCHGATPASGVDPIVVAAHIVLALQSIVSRELDPCEPVVVSVGRIHAGSTESIIPETAEIVGTFRTLTPKTREKVRAAIVRIATGAAGMYRATASVEFDSSAYVPLYNDPVMCDFMRQAIHSGLAEDVIMDVATPSMAAEDFAFYLQQVPGAFLWLGMQRDTGDTPPLHSPHFDFNDDVLATGIGVWLSLVAAFSQQSNSRS